MKTLLTLTLFCFAAAATGPALAYIGPGAGLSLLGALWGLIAAVGAALLFVILWPLRRYLRRRAERAEHDAEIEAEVDRLEREIATVLSRPDTAERPDAHVRPETGARPEIGVPGAPDGKPPEPVPAPRRAAR